MACARPPRSPSRYLRSPCNHPLPLHSHSRYPRPLRSPSNRPRPLTRPSSCRQQPRCPPRAAPLRLLSGLLIRAPQALHPRPRTLHGLASLGPCKTLTLAFTPALTPALTSSAAGLWVQSWGGSCCTCRFMARSRRGSRRRGHWRWTARSCRPSASTARWCWRSTAQVNHEGVGDPWSWKAFRV